jgi:hypothetical protein
VALAIFTPIHLLLENKASIDVQTLQFFTITKISEISLTQRDSAKREICPLHLPYAFQKNMMVAILVAQGLGRKPGYTP